MTEHTVHAKTLPAPLGPRMWTALIVLGLVGQLAWTVENMYLNVFVYKTITTHPTVTAALVASSAIAATLATMLIGALSDRLGKRKAFMTYGYVLWGASTAAFGFIQVDGTAGAFKDAVALAVLAIITLDCVMSFLGSGANDAAFQAWVTDSTVPANRGRVDGVVVIMPLVSMLIVFGLLDPLTKDGRWMEFFAIIGGFVMLTGIAAHWLVDDPTEPVVTSTSYFRDVVSGLTPSAVRANPFLYATLLGWLVWAISVQVYLPYLIIYIEQYLKIDAYAIVLGVVLILASVASILGGRIMDRIGKVAFLMPAGALYCAGLAAMFFARGFTAAIVAGTIMMSGFMFVNAAFSALVRDASPHRGAGRVQGLRMIGSILIPSVIGPFIGAAAIRGTGSYVDEFGATQSVPTPTIFAAALVVAVISLAPVLLVRRLHPAFLARPALEETEPA